MVGNLHQRSVKIQEQGRVRRDAQRGRGREIARLSAMFRQRETVAWIGHCVQSCTISRDMASPKASGRRRRARYKARRAVARVGRQAYPAGGMPGVLPGVLPSVLSRLDNNIQGPEQFRPLTCAGRIEIGARIGGSVLVGAMDRGSVLEALISVFETGRRALERWSALDVQWANAILALAGLILAGLLANWLAKKLVVHPVERLIDRTPLRNEAGDVRALVTHLANVVPAVFLLQGVPEIAGLPGGLVVVVQALARAFIVLTLARALCDLLELGNDAYELKPEAAMRPIKGYIQIGKIIVFAAAALLIVAILIGQSPVILLSGLGAAAAVLMLVFRDTILSLVASVQLRSNDMLRVGDWIEMPQLNADGDVIDIALHTVKVQNFDKTVTAIPTAKLITDSFRNWRHMREWGGRRIKRALRLDQTSVAFLTPVQWEALRAFAILRPYMAQKDAEIARWNQCNHVSGGPAQPGVNQRQPTNLGTFRAYVAAYLKAHPRVSDQGTLLVRQLDATETGLPLEIYCFTTTTDWLEYEAIQADIFDHLIAIVPRFGLRLFQRPGGFDVALARAGDRGQGAAAGNEIAPSS
ncbi:mechanosensitive ion channel family protein [Novosphingobium sp. 1949]|uniref:Mechanosensitive ion channel family protein n=1 Tax=Novosphingobium organovorum TaxID=2930092 RepID=A0ABT0BDH4_9SPHN|nr:mechanosensitive ion channel domain-containing protein [Novosphingobium organovorum]MCJ2183112.1 mechanosensitive ion channel family protein [Novosphingobium organovorum]